MTSMIFGSIYMGHQAYVHHKRQKQREKNYRRWEDLRDEYDEQKRTTRETRSLDIQRTGTWGDDQYSQDASAQYGPREERPILTLRDQQEANDARMSWRPQEAWEPSHRALGSSLPHTGSQLSVASAAPSQTQIPLEQPVQHPHLHHAATTPSAYWQNRGQLKPQKTGATWDEGLPAPLRVSRRSYEDYDHSQYRRGSASAQTTAPLARQGQVDLLTNSDSRSQSQSRRSSAVPSRVGTPGPAPMATSQSPLFQEVYAQPETQPQFVRDGAALSPDDLMAKLANISIEPVRSHVPGGRMAELIERGY